MDKVSVVWKSALQVKLKYHGFFQATTLSVLLSEMTGKETRWHVYMDASCCIESNLEKKIL